MSCRIVKLLHQVMSSSNDLTIEHEHGSNRDLIFLEGLASLEKSLGHEGTCLLSHLKCSVINELRIERIYE